MSNVWNIADRIAGPLDRECPDCDGTGWTDPHCDQVLAEASRKPVSDAAREKLHFVFFDALPERQFRVMARNGSHAVTRLRAAYDFPVACLASFCAYLAC